MHLGAQKYGDILRTSCIPRVCVPNNGSLLMSVRTQQWLIVDVIIASIVYRYRWWGGTVLSNWPISANFRCRNSLYQYTLTEAYLWGTHLVCFAPHSWVRCVAYQWGTVRVCVQTPIEVRYVLLWHAPHRNGIAMACFQTSLAWVRFA